MYCWHIYEWYEIKRREAKRRAEWRTYWRREVKRAHAMPYSYTR